MSAAVRAKMEKRVCVTGAGGFIASWLVKLLLSKGYTVHGTVRDPRAIVKVEPRNSRETTPCSMIKRDSETIGTPDSTNRPTSLTANNRRIQSPTPSNFPYTREMEKFFAEPEERQQKEFAEMYNFNPVKDTPLPGRYEWVKLKC